MKRSITGVGAGTLLSNTADENTATDAGALLSNTTGALNTAHGAFALFSNTTGGENTANGFESLFNNATGNDNTAIGDSALFSNTAGGDNTAIGYHALFQNTGDLNTATGWQALNNNTTGAANTADGLSALLNNTTGNFNTAIGETALQNNATGSENTATGHNALAGNTTGVQNTAIGNLALENNTSGNINVAVGVAALQNCTTGQANAAIGVNAGSNVTTANGVTCLNASGENVDQTTWINGVFGVTTQSGTTLPVVVSSAGQLGTLSSSRRFKKEIKSMDKASEAILALKPVTFCYKSDETSTPQFGLIAEEVAAVLPDLVVRGKNGEIYSVRYEAVNAMLLNEFLKEHRKGEEQQATIAELRSTVAQQQKGMETLTTRLNEQDAKIQRVDAQLELNTIARQTVANDQ